MLFDKISFFRPYFTFLTVMGRFLFTVPRFSCYQEKGNDSFVCYEYLACLAKTENITYAEWTLVKK